MMGQGYTVAVTSQFFHIKIKTTFEKTFEKTFKKKPSLGWSFFTGLTVWCPQARHQDIRTHEPPLRPFPHEWILWRESEVFSQC